MVTLHKSVATVDGGHEEQDQTAGSRQRRQYRLPTQGVLLPAIVAIALLALLAGMVGMTTGRAGRSEQGITPHVDSAGVPIESTDWKARMAPGTGLVEVFPGEEATSAPSLTTTAVGVGPVEWLPGETDTTLPPTTSGHEPSPLIGPQP